MLFLICCLLFAAFPERVLVGAQSGLALSLNAVVPSLLPFMLVSTCLIKSKFSYPLGSIVSKILSPILGISPTGCVCLITGLIGGYGAGAKAVFECYKEKEIDKEEAETLLAFSNNAGPLFVIGTVGISFFSHRQTGIILYIVQVITALFLCVIFCFNNKYEKTSVAKEWEFYKKNKPPIGELIAKSAASSGKAIISVVVFVVAFSAISQILPTERFPLISGILEVTKGCSELSRRGTKILPLISALLSWGGLSVHFQTNALAGGQLNLRKYYIGKITGAIVSYFITYFVYSDPYLMLFLSIVIFSVFLCFLVVKNLILKQLRQP